MKFLPLDILGCYEIILTPFRDQRGSFITTYEQNAFSAEGLVTDWCADNQSVNLQKGILRGFHFQKPPFAQTKLVRAVVGNALDVFIDLRKESPTFLKVGAVELSEENANAVYLPKGIGHCYLTLSDFCIVSYKVDAPYSPKDEGGVRWNDPVIRFDWPLKDEPVTSDKDKLWPLVDDVGSPF